jgi:tRNA1Val (adenine37-N6)-methyltransferase
LNIKHFPRGLKQPEKGFRFSVDALLLSTFIRPGEGWKILDLGCGCGVVGLGIILANPELNLKVTGVDCDPQMLSCAEENAKNLGVKDRYQALLLDIKQINRSSVEAESFDLVLMNPPYRPHGQGRISPYKEKNIARFETSATLNTFVRAARFAVKNKKMVGIIYLAERLAEVMTELKANRLTPKKMRPVYGRMNKPAKLFLLQAVKNGGPGLCLEPPLILYKDGPANILTDQAREFCQFL